MKKITQSTISVPASPWPNHAPTVATQNVLTILTAALYNIFVPTSETAPSTRLTVTSLATAGASSTTNTEAVRRFIGKHPRLLIADDQQTAQKLHKKAAIQLGFSPENIVVCNNRSEALQAIHAAIEEKQPFGAVFSDRDMGNETDGDLLAEEVSRLENPPHFIMISGTLPEQLPRGVDFGIHKGASLKNQLSAHLGSLP